MRNTLRRADASVEELLDRYHADGVRQHCRAWTRPRDLLASLLRSSSREAFGGRARGRCTSR